MEDRVVKYKFFSWLLVGICLVSPIAFAATDPGSSQSADEKLQAAKEQIAQDAAFIRQVCSDPKMTLDQKKTAIAEFLRKQNEKSL